MYKVVVAGAGHGGLTAAALLAKNGVDVTVIEAKKREDLGYDWEDSLRKSTFEFTGIPLPEDEHFRQCYTMSYMNPNKSVKLKDTREPGNNIKYVERKYILKYLTDYAESCGVKFLFETSVLSAICDTEKVIGLKIKKDGITENLRADIVIDAAGMNSPVRESLPACFGVENKVNPKYIFTVYRAYYEKLSDEFTDPRYCVMFYNGRRCGMDWMITEENHMDVLIGNFSPSLTQEEVDISLKEIKKLYPYLGDKLLRGGSVEQIPVGKMLGKIVCGGYAAVGDSAFMTEALSGSGMDFAIKAGKILADTITEADGDFSVEKLWKYQYTFFKKLYKGQLTSYLIKSLLTDLDADDLDYLFEKKILTGKEMYSRGNAKYGVGEIASKAAYLCAKPKILKALADMGVKMLSVSKLDELMPENYTDEEFKTWYSEYIKL